MGKVTRLFPAVHGRPAGAPLGIAGEYGDRWEISWVNHSVGTHGRSKGKCESTDEGNCGSPFFSSASSENVNLFFSGASSENYELHVYCVIWWVYHHFQFFSSLFLVLLIIKYIAFGAPMPCGADSSL